ncbi:golgin subfamily B member 1-like [Anolis sagrei]|uniref:golgin subfamily B member 1-like n=1 Tax=Anolis sagrei TaxID=38937 RepID=UPI003522072F
MTQWDLRGLATPCNVEPSGMVAALERKYRVLQRKLCTEMLTAHYGQAAWASLPYNVKEEKISELEMLVDFALREGSILSLHTLPGAQHIVRSGPQAAQSDLAAGPLDPLAIKGTASHALQQLQRKKVAEMASLDTQQHFLAGSSNSEISHRLLHLHAQTGLVQQEVSFQAALLVLELFTGERFWESEPVAPEDCHWELARLRLTAGRGSEQAWHPCEAAHGRSMTQVLLDRLLIQQERDRNALVQILLNLEKKENIQGQSHGEEQQSHLEAESSVAAAPPSLREALTQVLAMSRERLQVTRQAAVSWQDCAISVLVNVQQEQQQELIHALVDLAQIASSQEGETCPALYEKFLSRLQEPPLISLVQRLHASSSQQPMQGTLQVDQKVCPIHKTSPSPPEVNPTEETLWREEILGSLQKGKEGEDKRLIKMTSEDLSAQPDLQQIMHHDVGTFKLQAEADRPQTQMQQHRKLLQTQEFPEQLQTPEDFQQDLKDIRDLQKVLEIPLSQRETQEQMEGLVPHQSPKQQETGMKFSKVQRGMESEVFDSQEEESPVPCWFPELSEGKDPKAGRDGDFGSLQDSSQQQEVSQEAVVMEEMTSQELLLRKSKTLASLEFAASETLLHQGLRHPEIPLQMEQQKEMGVLDTQVKQQKEMGVLDTQVKQQKEMGVLDTQVSSEPQRETEIVQDEMRTGIDVERHISPKEKQEPPKIQQKVFVLEDEGNCKTLQTQRTPVFLPEEQRDSEVHQKILKAYKGSLTLQAPGTRSSKDPCQEEQNIPDPSQLQSIFLKKSKSLEPQELSRANEYVGSAEIQQEHKYPQAPHSQEWKGTKAQEIPQKKMEALKDQHLREGLQCQTFPESKPESVGTPELLQKEVEASKLKKKLQAVEVSSKETQVPSPEAQKTDICQASMEILHGTQIIHSDCQEETEDLSPHIGRASKGKSLDPEDIGRTQEVRQQAKFTTTMQERRRFQDHLHEEMDVPQSERRPMENLDVAEAPQRSSYTRISGREHKVSEILQETELGGPDVFQGSEFLQRDQADLAFQGGHHNHPIEESQITTQGQTGTELHHPQTPPFCGFLWRKSKSLDVKRTPGFHLQEPKEPEGPSEQSQHPQTDREDRQSKDFLSQSQQTQIPPPEELPLEEKKVLQVQQMAQNGDRSQDVKEMDGFSSEERRQTEIHTMQQTQMDKPASPDLRESLPEPQPHEKKSLESSSAQQSTLQKYAEIPQIFMDPESPPLLWRVLDHKAKSFELGEAHVFLSSEFKLTLAEEATQKEMCVPQLSQEVKGVSMVQPQREPSMESETQKSQEIRSPAIFHPRGLESPAVPQIQAEDLPVGREYQDVKTSRISPEQSKVLTPGRIKDIQPQDMRELEDTLVEKVLQRRPQIFHRQESPQTETELLKHSGTFIETSELQESKCPETPPLLWGALKFKSKSLELRLPQSLETQELKETLRVQSQRSQMQPETQKTLECQNGTSISLQESKEAEIAQVQTGKESLKTELMLSTSPEIPQPKASLPEMVISPFLKQEKDLQGELKMSLETPQAQGMTNVSETQERVPEKLKDPEAIGQELMVPQTLQPHDNEYLEISEAQGSVPPFKMVLLRKEHRSPDTSPPLLWTTLGTKAKSFELRKPRIFQTQDLREMELTIFPQKLSQEESQAPKIQELQKLQMVPSQRELDTEAEFHKKQGCEDPKIFHTSELKEQETPQVQADCEIFHFEGISLTDRPNSQLPDLQEERCPEGLCLQEPREVEVPEDPQRRQTTSQSYPVQQQGLKEPENFQFYERGPSDLLQSQPAPEGQNWFFQHNKRRSPETPPLLWWTLELAQQGMQHMCLLVSPQPQEITEPPETDLQENQKGKPKSPKQKEVTDQKNLYSQDLEASAIEKYIFLNEGMLSTVASLQERRDPKSPQAQDIPFEVQSMCSELSTSQQVESQVPGRAELTQSPRRSPQTLEVEILKKMECAQPEKSPQMEQDIKEIQSSSEKQKIITPEEMKELKGSLLQDKKPQMCYSYKVGETECLLSSGGLVRKSKSLDIMKLRAPKPQELCEMESPQIQGETENRTKDFVMAPEDFQMKPTEKKDLQSIKYDGKSDAKGMASVVLENLQMKPTEKKDPQSIKSEQKKDSEGIVTVVPEDLQMKTPTKKGFQSFKPNGKISLENVQVHSTPYLLQTQEPGTESHSGPSSLPLQNVLELKSEFLQVVEPTICQSQEQQEGTVLQLQGSPQMNLENLQFTGIMDSKTFCSQGHCEAGSCGFGVEEDNQVEIPGILQRHPQSSLVREATWPQTPFLRWLKSLELHELSGPQALLLQELKKPEITQAPEGHPGCPEFSEAQVMKSWGKCPSTQEGAQMVKSSLQDLKISKNGTGFPTQKDKSFQRTPTPQKGLEENNPCALGSQEDFNSTVEQVQACKEAEVLQPVGAPQLHVRLQGMEGLPNNSESFVPLESTTSRSSYPLPVGEAQMKVSETPELMKSPTQVPSSTMETKSLLPSWILRKSKSLDLQELQTLQPLALEGDLQGPSNSKIYHSQRKLEDESSEPQKIKGSVVLCSKILPDHSQKDKVGLQLQEERMCEAQKTVPMGLKSNQNQEQIGNNGEVLCSQAVGDIQMFGLKECGDVKLLTLQEYPLSVNEPPQIQGYVQTEPDLHGLMGPQLHLDPQEERDLQGSPLLSSLLRKSKTFGLELLRRSDVSFPVSESRHSQVTLEPGTQLLQESIEQESCNVQIISKMEVHQQQEIQNVVEGTLESPKILESKGVAHRKEVELMEAQKSLPMSQDLLQEQRSPPVVDLQSRLSLPPHEVPQFGIHLLQELGRLHNELESLRHQELKNEENFHPQKTQYVLEPEDPETATSSQILQHQEWRSTEFYQPLAIVHRISEVHGAQRATQKATPSPPKAQGMCQVPAALKEPEGSTDLPAVKVPEMDVPKISPVVSGGMMSLHVLQSQEPKSHCIQETTQSGWESFEDAEKMLEMGTRPIKSQEEKTGSLLTMSTTPEHQDLLRMTQNIQCKLLTGVEDLHSQVGEKGLQQIVSPQDPFCKPSQGLRSQDPEIRALFHPLNQKKPKTQQLEEHFQREEETFPSPKSRHINSIQLQEDEKEMGSIEPWQLEEPPTSQECKKERVWSTEGTQQRGLSALAFCPPDLNRLESGALKGRLEEPAPWEQKEEAPQTWKTTVVSMLSPPSPGTWDEELRWEPAAHGTGFFKEISTNVAPAENTARPCGPAPPPRPPCREKAFIWFSKEEKEEALHRLAALQAEGELRRQRDKERQILRFQERLSIAKRRKSEEDLLGSSPTEPRILPAAHLCQQDQDGRKTAVKRHLEKVKRERTYVMQSKRERNTSRFKELLNPLVTHGEESPDPGHLGDV